MGEYIATHTNAILVQVRDHILISLYAVLIAVLIGVVAGYFASRSTAAERLLSVPFSVLRVVPSLAILVLLIPIMGAGMGSAVTALTILAVPPVFLNTIVGFREVPDFVKESAGGIGMTERETLWKVEVPLAMMIVENIDTIIIKTIQIHYLKVC